MKLLPTQQMALLRLCVMFTLLGLQHCLPAAQAEKVPECTCNCHPGVPGTPGHNGLPGRDGKDGVTSPKGEKGDTGMMGAHGPPGKLGPIGPVGASGRGGPIGAPGPDGLVGAVGPSGQKGDPGHAGPLPDINLGELQTELHTLKDVLNKITQFYFTKRVGKKYFLSDKTSGTFDAAVKLCSTVSGFPALPASLEENQVLSTFLSDSQQYAWLSANDRKTEGKFVDLQDKALQYSSWKDKEPNNSGGIEDCAMIYSNGSWNDVGCEKSFLIICEI
ncbi:hypothetical protein SKAU_G00422250 [Synaphobranchus kaupii]|uniref:C-type lectin domain-containing protein n=1 Tax=Synaphobranchus kaupii TaxID=118154 RepID=A0A9Q1IBA5_SYNKA|nr:hypothetical protein SKAU_G00422250 [Synaphobranchus kaupii]